MEAQLAEAPGGRGGVGVGQGARAHLDPVHPINAMQHVLEELLQVQRLLQPLAPGPQQLLQVVPQAQDVVLAGRDALLVMVVLQLQLLGQVLQGPHPLLVGSRVCLDSLVLLLGGLHCCQVVPEVILSPREEGEQAAWLGSSWLVPKPRETAGLLGATSAGKSSSPKGYFCHLFQPILSATSSKD